MASTSANQTRAKSVDNSDFQCSHWDSYKDFSTHIRNKSTQLRSSAQKFDYFTTLSQDFVVPNSRADPDLVNFRTHLYGAVKRDLLTLQEQNRPLQQDEIVGDRQYKLFLENLRVDGQSYVLDIPQDGVFVKYEPKHETPTHSASDYSANHTLVRRDSRVKEEEQDYDDDPPHKKKPVQLLDLAVVCIRDLMDSVLKFCLVSFVLLPF